MGDFNYPDIDWITQTVNPGATAETHRFLECLDDNFVTQHVTEHRRSKAVLDLVMTRDPYIISSVNVMEPLGGSDHNMVTFVVHHQRDIGNNVKEVRDYSTASYAKIRSELASTGTSCWLVALVIDGLALKTLYLT